MSGAQLETSGQIRNSYPYIASTSISTTITLTSANNTENALTFTERVPFDKGPDKSGRVFLCINGVFLRVAADSYGTPPTFSGFIYYRTLEGKKIYLTVIESSFSAPFSESNPNIKLSPDTSLNADSINSLGYLGFENIVTSFGSATGITITARLNIGFYGDYAEPNWTELFKMPVHEHTGLPNQDFTSFLDNER